MALAPEFRYNAKYLHTGVDLHIEPNPETDHTTPYRTATYGDYGSYNEPYSLKATCDLYIAYSNISWTINSDNSTTVTGNIDGCTLTRTFVASSTNQQEVQVWFNNVRVFYEIIGTSQAGTWNLNVPSTFSVTIPPSLDPQWQYPAAIHFKNHNIGTTVEPDEFDFGLAILNPNPPDYRPGTILDGSSVWQSHNRSGGTAHILTSGGTWSEMRTLDAPTGKGNPPSIRKSDAWFNMAKLGKE